MPFLGADREDWIPGRPEWLEAVGVIAGLLEVRVGLFAGPDDAEAGGCALELKAM